MKNALEIIIDRTVFRRTQKFHAFHVIAMQLDRTECAIQLVASVRAKLALRGPNVKSVRPAIRANIVANVIVMCAAQCRAANVNRIVNAK